MQASSASVSSIHAAVLARWQATLEMQPLVAGSAGLAERSFMTILNKEAEESGMDSGAFEQKFGLFNELLQSLRPSACYESRNQFLIIVRALIPSLSILWYSSTFDKPLTKLCLDELARLHKRILAGIPDDTFHVALMDAKKYKEERKASLAPSYVGLWLDWLKDDKKQRCQVVAYLRQRDQFVIANAQGEKVGDLDFDGFEDLIRVGKIHILENNSQFGNTLATVIDGMREQ